MKKIVSQVLTVIIICASTLSFFGLNLKAANDVTSVSFSSASYPNNRSMVYYNNQYYFYSITGYQNDSNLYYTVFNKDLSIADTGSFNTNLGTISTIALTTNTGSLNWVALAGSSHYYGTHKSTSGTYFGYHNAGFMDLALINGYVTRFDNGYSNGNYTRVSTTNNEVSLKWASGGWGNGWRVFPYDNSSALAIAANIGKYKITVDSAGTISYIQNPSEFPSDIDISDNGFSRIQIDENKKFHYMPASNIYKNQQGANVSLPLTEGTGNVADYALNLSPNYAVCLVLYNDYKADYFVINRTTSSIVKSGSYLSANRKKIIPIQSVGPSDGSVFALANFGTSGAELIKINLNSVPTPPTITSYTDGQTINSSTPTISWNFNDPDSGDTQGAYQLVCSNDNWATWYWDSGKVSTNTTSRTLPSLPDGTWQFALQTWDNSDAGPSGWGAYRSNIKIDTTAPTVPTINFTTPNGYTSGSWTNQDVTFTIANGTDTGSGTQKSQYSINGGTSWSDYTTAVTISTTGTTTVLARTLDKVGNISSNATAVINISKTAPTNCSIMINNGVNYANTVPFTLTLGATNASKMFLSKNSTVPTPTSPAVAGTSTGWVTYTASYSWNSVTSDGTQTIYAWYMDAATNISPVVSASITYDTTPPTGTFVIGDGGFENTTNWTLSITSTDAAQIYVSSSNILPPTPVWENYTGTSTIPMAKAWTYSGSEGPVTLYTWLKDTAGNVSQAIPAGITYDITPATGTMTISAVNGSNVTLVFTKTYTYANVNKIILSNSPDFSNSQEYDYADVVTDWHIDSSTSGLKVIYAKYRDWAGNVSNIFNASANIGDVNNLGISASYLNWVGHNQVLKIGGSLYEVTSPDTLTQGYELPNGVPLTGNNVFTDGDYVTYRLEFDIANQAIADKIKDIIIKLELNEGNSDAIDFEMKNIQLEKYNPLGNKYDGSDYVIIKYLNDSYSSKGRNNYLINIGNDLSGNPMIEANGSGRYAIEYKCKLHVNKSSYDSSETSVTITNDATIAIINSNDSCQIETLYPYNLSKKGYIDTNISRLTIEYR